MTITCCSASWLPWSLKILPMQPRKEAARVIHRNDAPILAAARIAVVDYLVTWNTRDFLTDRVRDWASFPVLTPGEFLRIFRDALDKDG